MKPAGPVREFQTLDRFIRQLETKFLADHLGTQTLTTPNRDEVLDVAAFVVLTHGAFENFVEGVCLWAIDTLEGSWRLRKRISRGSASLLLYVEPPAADWEVPETVYDNLRKAMSQAKNSTATKVKQNNGIAMKHLRSLLRPLGIEVPEDPKLIGALDLLVALRHEWAHQYRYGAKRIRFAADVKATAADCLELASRISKNARSLSR